MKVCVFLLLAGILPVIYGAAFGSEPIDILASYSTLCARQTNISSSTLLQVGLQNPPDDDPVYKNFILCYLHKMGILDASGNFAENTDTLEIWLSHEEATKQLDTAKSKCGHVKGNTAADSAALINRCFISKN